MRRIFGVIAALVVANWAAAQEPEPLAPPKDVPVKVDEAPVVKPEPEPKVRGPLGPEWGPDEYILWWLAPQPLPPALVRSRNNSFPTLGTPGNQLVIGNRTDPQAHSGGRFFSGWAIDHEQTIGMEGGYFFLGSRSRTVAAQSAGGVGDPTLARPYLLAEGAAPTADIIAAPGVIAGGMELVASARMQGAEVNGVANLFADAGFKLDGLVGFRFLQMNEGLRIAARSSYGLGPFTSVSDTVDQIDGHNVFYGGQLGLRLDWQHGHAFAELGGKVAFGQTNEVVKINGLTVINTNGLTDVAPYGFYAGPNNSGRASHSVFSVLPESTAKVGWVNNGHRIYVGYNFLYLSRLVRPGDQIDPVLQYRNLATIDTVPGFVPERPRLETRQGNLWAQGLTIGLEVRY